MRWQRYVPSVAILLLGAACWRVPMFPLPREMPPSPLPPPAPPRPTFAAEIRGRVLDGAGAPVGGAQVDVYDHVAFDERRVADATTEPDGAFAFRGVALREKCHVSVIAWHPRLSMDGREFRPEAYTELVLRLPGPATVEGRVMHSHRCGFWRATVSVARIGGTPGFFLPGPVRRRFVTHTGLRGRFSIAGLPRGRSAYLRVTAAGYAEACSLETPGRPRPAYGGHFTHVALCGAGGIRGVVTFARTGAPAPGVRVAGRLRSWRSGRWWPGVHGEHPGWAETVTDAAGRYRLTGLDEGEWDVNAWPCDRSPLPWNRAHPLWLGSPWGMATAVSSPWLRLARTAPRYPGRIGVARKPSADWVPGPDVRVRIAEWETKSGVDLKLGEASLIAVRTVDAETGMPVPGVQVAIGGEGVPLESATSAWTDREGRTLLGAPPGRCRAGLCYWTHRGEYVLDPQRMHNLEQTVDAVAGQTHTVVFRLRRGVRLEGRAVDRQGRPVAGALVWVWFGNGARSDAQGRFRLLGLEPAVPVRVWARKGALGMREPLELTPERDGAITLTLAPGDAGAVTGRVVGQDGKPAAGIPLRFSQVVPPWETDLPLLDDLIDPPWTGTDGTFRFEGAWAGQCYRVGPDKGSLTKPFEAHRDQDCRVPDIVTEEPPRDD
ncbi:MAG: carboxypeptidase regulatory-like domain-containing protein [Armatimonadetes bacterium]|nr:carboxypeptidase regulatory-like domain-containing protein [Armatimonadota bacterium]